MGDILLAGSVLFLVFGLLCNMTCNAHPPGHTETTLKTELNRLLFRASIPLMVLGAIGLGAMLVGRLLPRVLAVDADDKSTPEVQPPKDDAACDDTVTPSEGAESETE